MRLLGSYKEGAQSPSNKNKEKLVVNVTDKEFMRKLVRDDEMNCVRLICT